MTPPDAQIGAATPTSPAKLGLVFALAAATLYGITIVFARIAFNGGANPGAVMELRFLAVAVTMAVVMRWRGRSFAVPRQVRLRLGLVCLGVFAVATGYIYSILFIPVSLAALIFYTFPLIVAAVAPALERSWPRPALLAAFPVAFAGLALALGASFSGLDWRGVAFAGLASVGGAYIFIVAPKAVAQYDVFGVTFYVGFSNVILMGLMILVYEGVTLPVTGLGWTGLIGVAVFYTIANLSMFAALKAAGATTSALVFNLEPLVAILGAVLLLGERLSPAQMGGVALVIGALMLATLGRGRAAASAAAANDSETPGPPGP